MPNQIKPGEPSGCIESTQVTMVFSNGYKACLNSTDEVISASEKVLDELLLKTKWFNSPIPNEGYFMVVDYKTNDIFLPTMRYFKDKDIVYVVSMPERGEEA